MASKCKTLAFVNGQFIDNSQWIRPILANKSVVDY